MVFMNDENVSLHFEKRVKGDYFDDFNSSYSYVPLRHITENVNLREK